MITLQCADILLPGKSTKKFAPKKAPARRPLDATSTQISARPSAERSLEPQSLLSRPAQSRITASPVISETIFTPVTSESASGSALAELHRENGPTPISIPSRDPSVARTPSVQPVIPQKRNIEPRQTPNQSASSIPISRPILSNAATSSTAANIVPPAQPKPASNPRNLDAPSPKRRRVASKQKQTTAASQSWHETDPNIALPTTEAVDGVTSEKASQKNASTSTQLAKKNGARFSAAEKRKQQVEETARRASETATAKMEKPRRKRGDDAKEKHQDEGQEIEDDVQDPQEGASQNLSSPKTNTAKRSAKSRRKKAIEDAAAAVVENAVQGSSQSVQKRGRHSRRAVTPDEAQYVRIDVAETKMADLCKDGGTGQKSSADKIIRENERAAIEKKKQQEVQSIVGQADEPTTQALEVRESRLDRLDREWRQREEAMANIVPQQRIINGEIVLDTSSLRIDRHAMAAVERDAEQLESVEEDEYTRKVNSSLGLKRDKSGGWNEMLLDRFYDGLRMFGTDFGMISKMFPGRTRHAIKLKFCREEREDYPRIRAALLGEVLPVELEEFQKLTGEEYEDPAVLERDIEEDKKRLEEEQELEKQAIEAARRERAEQAEAERLAAQAEESSSKENRRQRKKKGGKARKRREKGEKVQKAPTRSKRKRSRMAEGGAKKVARERSVEAS